MNRGILYLLLGVVCIGLLFAGIPLWAKLLLAWVAISSVYFGVGYLSGYGEFLRKSDKGRVPLLMKLIFLPVFAGIILYHLVARRFDPAPPMQEIRDGIWLGRRMTPMDRQLFVESGVKAVLDVTAEFDAPGSDLLPADVEYLNVPVFDHSIPRTGQLTKAVHWIARQREAGRGVLVHCALGQGRSVTVILAYLLHLNPSASIESLLEEVRKTRQTARPNKRQLRMLKKLRESGAASGRRRTVLVFNPVSGTRDAAADLRDIRANLEPFLDLEVKETTREISAEELTRQAIEEGADQVIAGGGDGTVTAVASELVGTGIALGIIPRGTANALSVCLFGPGIRIDPVNLCCKHILSGIVRPIDVADCDGKLMLLLAGVGIERGMVERADRDLKTRFGVLAYMVGAWQEIEGGELFDVELEVDGEQHRFRSGSVTVANAAPSTSIFAQGKGPPVLDDGLLDVTAIVDVKSQAEAVQIMGDLFRGAYEKGKGGGKVLHFRGKTIRLSTDPPQKLVFDGEIEGMTPVTFETKARMLDVLVDEGKFTDDLAFLPFGKEPEMR